MQPDEHVCLCFRVTRRKLTNFVLRERPAVLSQMSQCGGAGTGCGWCIPFLSKIFTATTEARSDLEVFSAEEYARRRAEYLETGTRRADPDHPARPDDVPS